MTKETELLMIVNPVAGHGRHRSLVTAVHQHMVERSVPIQLETMSGAGHARTLAQKAVEDGCQRVIACGGDGTVHEVVNALAGTDTLMGIIPCGRANDLARVLRIPTNPHSLTNQLLTGTTRRIDLGRLNGEYFCGVATCGFDSEVAEATRDESPFSGATTYVYAALKTLLRYRYKSVRLSGDFGTYEGSIFLAATANCPAYGGGMKIAPTAKLDDGLLDVCIIREISKLTILLLLRQVFTGNHVQHPAVDVYKTKTLSIESELSLTLFADGEPAGSTPAFLEAIPKTLTILAPDKTHQQ